MRSKVSVLVCALVVTTPTLAEAAPPEASAPEGASPEPAPAPTESSPTQTQPDPVPVPWLQRWAPVAHMGELGLYAGLLRFSPRHELFEPDAALPDQGYRPLRRNNPEFGARIGYYPLRFLGFEVEAGVAPSRIDDDGGARALPFTARGHAVLQLGLWSVTPFVLIGAGLLGVQSDRDALGRDVDPALHMGGGVKIYINRDLVFRVDLRDVVSNKQGVEETFEAHNFEFLLGLSATLGRTRDRDRDRDRPPADADADSDGIPDSRDRCPDQAEDLDGFEDEDGCPEADPSVPEPDGDADGVPDSLDACPAVPGPGADGCPSDDQSRDQDGDGIPDPEDLCPTVPETFNEIEDTDGCPEQLIEGAIIDRDTLRGITFETNSAIIQRSSLPSLDQVVRQLVEYDQVYVKIVGYTDDRGDPEHNIDLSRRRAESVASYLTGMGVDESRLSTEGLGAADPVASNDTRSGRADNRRIEFQVVPNPGTP